MTPRIELAAHKADLLGQTENLAQALAHTTNLSERTVQRYMRIKTNGNPDILQKVMSGQIKIGTAHRQLEAELIVTTTEPLTSEPPSPEKQHFYRTWGIKNNLHRLNSLYALLSQQTSDIPSYADKKMERQCKRFKKLMG